MPTLVWKAYEKECRRCVRNRTDTNFPQQNQGVRKRQSQALTGTLFDNRRIRTRRVDKGKSGQAQKTAVSGGFGGGILSHDLSRRLTLLGEQSDVCDAVEEQ